MLEITRRLRLEKVWSKLCVVDIRTMRMPYSTNSMNIENVKIYDSAYITHTQRIYVFHTNKNVFLSLLNNPLEAIQSRQLLCVCAGYADSRGHYVGASSYSYPHVYYTLI